MEDNKALITGVVIGFIAGLFISLPTLIIITVIIIGILTFIL